MSVPKNYYKGSATLISNDEKPPNKIQIRPRIREKSSYPDPLYLLITVRTKVPVLSLVFMEIRNILMGLAPGIDTARYLFKAYRYTAVNPSSSFLNFVPTSLLLLKVRVTGTYTVDVTVS